jgi:EAL and modified HD-GYP domain-containing signal transduction protein
MHTFTSLSQNGHISKVPLFIPFPPNMLKGDQPLLLPKKEIVIEISSNIDVDDALIQHLKMLKKSGFRLALSDFALQPHLFPLVKLVHIVKIDFALITRKTLPKLLTLLKSSGITPMAQHVDDFVTLKLCRELEFKLLQGRFISRPSTTHSKNIPSSSIALLQLIKELERPDITPPEIEELIIMDPVLTVKILRVVNSAAYKLSQPITALQQAIVLLGQEQIRKWAILISLSGQEGKPEEISRNLLVRSRMCELLAESKELPSSESAFMVGMISLLDLILDVEMEQLLKQLPLDDNVKTAITEFRGDLGQLLQSVIAFEQGEFDKLNLTSTEKHFLDVAYRHSLSWTENAMQALSSTEH